MNEYQTKALTTLLNKTEVHLTYGLAAEVGEIMSLMQKCARGDSRYWEEREDSFFGNYTPLLEEKIFAEMGDVLWYLACLAEYHGFPLEAVAKYNLEKLGIRQEMGTIKGDGDDR
jgi:hypothetical protein